MIFGYEIHAVKYGLLVKDYCETQRSDITSKSFSCFSVCGKMQESGVTEPFPEVGV